MTAKRKDTRKGDRHRPGYWGPYQKARRERLKAVTDAAKKK